MKVVPVFLFIASTKQDACTDICTQLMGTCGANSSYCKNKKTCHDLFWENSGRLCNRSECASSQVVTCEEAVRLTEPNFGGSSAVARWIGGYSPDEVASIPGMKGVRNLANTCYLGAILQMLTHSDRLREYLARQKDPQFTAFNLLFRDQWSGTGQEALNPWALLDVLINHNGFGFDQQEDAHESLVALLGYLRLGDLFSIRVDRTRVCAHCTAPRTVTDTLLGLMLPIVGSSVADCLAANLAPEPEIPDVQCEAVGCKLRANAVFTPSIASWPPILIVSLIRFRFDGTKIDTDVQINQHLDEGYDLIGIVHHAGGGANDGHYITDFKMGTDWFEGNDETVVPKPPTLTGSTPYILMYEKTKSELRV